MRWLDANHASRSGAKYSTRTARTDIERTYLVATGAIVFRQHAPSAREALLLVKERLQAAYLTQPDPDDAGRLSWALLESFANGKLDFVVMDGERTRLICGEYRGGFEEPVTRGLADSLEQLIPAYLETERRWASRNLTATATCSAPVDSNAEAGHCAYVRN